MNAKRIMIENNRGSTTIQFSIGAKLITIITIIVLVSLGSITALVSWLVREDLRIAAEDNNFEVNRRSAMVTEETLENMHSNSLILMQAVDALGAGSALSEQTVELFFGQNPQIALLLFTVDGKKDDLLINKHFFLSREIDPSPTESLSETNRATLIRAASGETVLVNAVSWFKTPLIALFFPWRQGAGLVLFSPSNLSDSFGFGTNQSYLINDAGDILIHPDAELVNSGANVAKNNFTKQIWDSPQRNAQVQYTDEHGVRYFGAFTKLDSGGAVLITSIEYSKVFEGIAATTRRNIYLTFTVLCISILFIWFFSKSISVRIKTLAAAARSIGNGNFEVKLSPKGNDEIGILSTSFQQMSNALAVFGKFTNREIAMRAMRGEIKPGGLPKLATIFFSDIRDFTEKSTHFTKESGDEASNRIVLWLNDYFTRMVECIERTGGVVDKFNGDALMAHWGTVYTSGSARRDAFNCIFSALMMRKTLYTMNKSRSAEDWTNPPIRIGCGISTGIVTAGQIGSESRMEYTVIGDPVNLASRAEDLNKSLATDILITEETWELVKDFFLTKEMPPVRMKGRETPTRVFAVINFAKINKWPRTLEDVRKLLGISSVSYRRRITDISAGGATGEKAAPVHRV